jgi:Fe-S-cluster containining protein
VEEDFYTPGLRFSCTRCSDCCRHEPGFVFLSKKDLSALAEKLRMERSDFIETWCRWIPAGNREHLSLKEKPNFDCVFWDSGCSVYRSRPLQCRAFPVWPSILSSIHTWEAAAADCPGVGRGKLHSRERIAAWLAEQKEPLIARTKKQP